MLKSRKIAAMVMSLSANLSQKNKLSKVLRNAGRAEVGDGSQARADSCRVPTRVCSGKISTTCPLDNLLEYISKRVRYASAGSGGGTKDLIAT